MQQDEKYMTPITQEEYLRAYIQESNLSLPKAKEEVQELFAEAGKAGIQLHHQDAKELFDKDEDDPSIYELVSQDPKTVLWPTARPITPFPDIKLYDSKNWFDTRAGYFDEHDPNKSFKFSPVDPKIKEPNIRYRHKNQKGRSSRRRTAFSTINTPSQRLPFGVGDESLAIQYTGMMRKISNSYKS